MSDWCPENDGAYRAEMAAMFPVANRKRIEEIEAKLAKAVEALEFYATLIGEKHECPWHMLSDDYGEIARTTLAELTGGKE